MAEGGLLDVNRQSELAGVGLGFPGLVLACFGFFGGFWVFVCFFFGFWVLLELGEPVSIGSQLDLKIPKRDPLGP